MTTGSVASGRAEAIGRGTTLGIGAELGSGRAVGTDTAVGNGNALGSGAASVGIASVGTASGGTATVGRGGSDGVAATSGVRGEAVHATDAISAKATSGRMSNLPTSERSKSFAIRPGRQRK